MIAVYINGERVNSSNETWSSVDPGGFEACTFNIPNDQHPAPGAWIRIFDGLQLVWEGRVEEPGDNYSSMAALGQVSGVGFGARLRDDTMSMIFIDRDLSRWQGMSVQRQINLGANSDPKSGPSVDVDTSTDAPALKMTVDGPIGGSNGGICEAFYDAGVDNLIGQVQFQSTVMQNVSGGGATWVFRLLSTTDDIYTTNTVETSDYDDTSASFTRESFASARRWAAFQFAYNASTAANVQRYRMVQNLAVIGDHGVTLRQNGAGADGFYPSDIANYVRGLASNIDAGVLGDASSFIVIHSTYLDRVPLEQIIDDMAKYMGWHWGVWESLSKMRTNPRLDFRARPTTQTATVKRRDCSQVTLAKSLSSMYNRARVSYLDPAGTRSSTIVTLNHPELAGITRTIDLDIGIAKAADAATYGNQILALSQSDSRAQGSLVLPPVVESPSGDKPSHMLRAGLDRLKILGMPSVSWISPVAANTYRIKRVASQVIGDGVSTTVEVDNGADLVEVLQARLGQAVFGGQP